MSLLARVSTLSPGAIIQSAPLNNEFNQLINCLNGTITTKNLLVKFSGTDPVIAVDQTSSGSIEEWRQAGSAKVRIENSGQLNSLIPTGTAPIIVTSTTKCTNLNAEQVDGFDLTGNKTAFSFGWFYSAPPGATEATNPSVHSFIVPEGTNITIVDVVVVFTGGSHTSGASLVWTIKRRNSSGTLQTDVGTATLDNSNNTIWIPYPNNISDVPLTTGDVLYPLLTTRSGTITETLVTVAIRGVQSFTS